MIGIVNVVECIIVYDRDSECIRVYHSIQVDSDSECIRGYNGI